MTRTRLFLLSVVLSFGVSACGQTGELYRPDAAPVPSPVSPPPRDVTPDTLPTPANEEADDEKTAAG